MKFTDLHIENFLAITKAELSLADRGLVLIQGENKDDTSAKSNGAGKSSLADALCWALYGETARGVSGDAVVNRKAGKGTVVWVEVEDGVERYRIARHRKHKTGKNALQVRKLDPATKVWSIDLTKGTDRLTQDVVDRIIGASHDVFKAAVYAGQEQMPDLPAMTDKNLKMLIEEASGVMLLEEAYTEARQRLAKAKEACATVAAAMDKLNDRKVVIADMITALETQSADWCVERDAKVRAAKIEVRNQLKEIRELDEAISAMNEPALDVALAEIDAKLGVLSADADEHRALSKRVAEHNAERAATQREMDTVKALYAKEKRVLETIQERLGTPCEECGRPHDDTTLGAAETKAKSNLEKTKRYFGELKARLAKEDEARDASQKAADEYAATMSSPAALTAERARVQALKSKVADAIHQRAMKAAAAKRAGERVRELEASVDPYAANIVTQRSALEKISSEIKALKANEKDANERLDVVESVCKVFSPGGVRAHILDEVTPFLNTQTARYLDALSDGHIEANWTTLVKTTKGELREKFSIEVTNGKGAESFAGMSGGEKRKVRIAAALALQDLVATRATKPIDLFIGDEIDDALDIRGLERLTQVLEEKARERGTVFVISHSDLRDWISQTLTVSKKDGETTLMLGAS